MTLTEKINEDLKTAMKAGEKLKTETLRSLRAGIIEFEKNGTGKTMGPDDEMKLLMTAAKKRREAIEMYDTNNRPELADKERSELEVITAYLPQQMSREAVEARVKVVINETGAAGPQDTNKVIPVLMKELKGKADGKMVQEIVKSLLV